MIGRGYEIKALLLTFYVQLLSKTQTKLQKMHATLYTVGMRLTTAL
jgi:hypothetical protein